MADLPPPDFDWVTARINCSAVGMLEVLRDAARANTAARNKYRPEGVTKGDRFGFNDRQGERGFSVWDSWGKERRGVDFTLEGNEINVITGNDATSFKALLTLADTGQCKFKVGDQELDAWHVLKRVLEPLFFRD